MEPTDPSPPSDAPHRAPLEIALGYVRMRAEGELRREELFQAQHSFGGLEVPSGFINPAQDTLKRVAAAVPPMPALLCFDAESESLIGPPFAVAAVLLDAGGALVDTFLARCRRIWPPDPWVEANVMPALEGVAITHDSIEAMALAFGRWARDAQGAHNALVLADCGFPVDTRMLHAAHDALGRTGEAPWVVYPLHDVASWTFAIGRDPRASHPDLAGPEHVATLLGTDALRRHHPLYDAAQSAAQARACLARLGFQNPT